MQSRYYDPVVGRFVNADGYVSTGQGLLGANMFIYCNNSPISYSDIIGCFRTYCVMLTDSGSAPVPLNSTNQANNKSATEKFENKDGSISLYDNRRHQPDSFFHEQILSAELTKPEISLKDGTVVLGSASLTTVTGGWEFDHLDLSVLDIGKAELAAGYKKGKLDVTAMASAWAPSITIKIWDWSIKISAHVGAIGGKINVGSGNFDVGASYGWGISLSINW